MRPADGIQQRTIGDVLESALNQGSVTELQGTGEILVLKENTVGIRGLAVDARLCPVPGSDQPLTEFGEHMAVGFPGITNNGLELVAGLPHGQFGPQRLNITKIEIRCHPAAKQEDPAGHLVGDIRIAITITAHPGCNADGGCLQGKALSGRVFQRRIQAPQKLWQGLPQTVFNNRKAPFGLIHCGWSLLTNLVGVPGFGNQLRQAIDDFLPFSRHEVVMVQTRQAVRHLVVFHNKGATRHLGGVGRQHKLDS